MKNERLKLKKTISVPLDLNMFNIISSIAKIEDVANTTIVRRALNKCYRPHEDLIES